MTEYNFKVNGKDFSRLVARYGYATDLKPVTVTYKDLDQVEHEKIVRYRGFLTVPLNPLLEADSAELCAELLKRPLMIEYDCLQRHVPVEANMRLTSVPMEYLAKAAGRRWMQAIKLDFEQL